MQSDHSEQPTAVLDEEQDDFGAERSLLRTTEKMEDAESQLPQRTEEQNENRSRTISYLGMYFLMNLSLTFYNKLVLGSVSSCPSKAARLNRG